MGPRVELRPPTERDRGEFIERLLASGELHDPWLEPAEPASWFDRLLARNRTETDRSLLVCDANDGSIAGVMNLSQIFMGRFRSAFLGYYAFEPFAGRGYMRAAMPALLRYAFDELGLHRVQANVQPGNEASIALVRGAGFHREGFSPRYLFIRGAWRDHEQWVMLADDDPAARSPRRCTRPGLGPEARRYRLPTAPDPEILDFRPARTPRSGD